MVEGKAAGGDKDNFEHHSISQGMSVCPGDKRAAVRREVKVM